MLGVGTDVLTSGGVTIQSSQDPQNTPLDSVIMAEGAANQARTIAKAVNFAALGNATNTKGGLANYILGGRREFGNQSNPLIISQSQLGLTAFPPAQTLRQNVGSGVYPANQDQNITVLDPLATVQIGGANASPGSAVPQQPERPADGGLLDHDQ